MTFRLSAPQYHGDATELITKNLPGGNPERYAMDILAMYSERIKNGDPLPIITEYWTGTKPAAKLMTVSIENYDHEDPAERALKVFQSSFGIEELESTFCITSYYDNLTLKELGDRNCIIIIMHVHGSLLTIIGSWDDDAEFTIHKPTDVENPVDVSWRGVTSENLKLLHGMPSMFAAPIDFMRFVENLGFHVEWNSERLPESMAKNGAHTTVERLDALVGFLRGDINLTDI
jgi:hypothetical protein